jgi:hypothetical protein
MPDQQAGSPDAERDDAPRAPEAGPGAAASPERDPATSPEADAAREEPGGREDPERPGASGRPVPRDLQDQQATGDDDHWDAAPDAAATGAEDQPGGTEEELPDTDEAGTGRQGAPRSASPHPEHPVPEEPAG